MFQTTGVDPESAQKEFEAVMASGAFERAPNLGVLFRYICRKTFEGRAGEIKEYNIAVEAFGREPGFDKRRDSIVRVEAHRLRKRLIQYYEEDGAAHDVRIVIPPGQYAPIFVRRPIERQTQLESSLPIPKRNRRALWAALAILASAFTAAGVYFPRHHVPAGGSGTAALGGTAVPLTDSVRIMAGSTAASYTDAFGVRWFEDQYFTGGTASTLVFRNIGRTRDPTVFLNRREGDFRYDIPLKPGVYEMRLFFAETDYGDGGIEGGGETSRLFRVLANDLPLLNLFDVISDAAGPNTADVKVFKDIEPAPDGRLHLRFVSQKAFAFVNAIEIVPGERGRLRPIRFVARATGYTDRQGRAWSPDSYYAGGRIVQRTEEVKQTPDPAIYQSERYGNFSYAIPVASGSYTVTLHFSESWHGPNRPGGGGAGSRLFDVLCNRTLLLEDFDIFAEAKGDYRAFTRTFSGLRPNAQGKLALFFIPTRNYASVNAIEVIDERR